MIDVEAREREVLSLLDGWPWRAGGVLIGGYATSAYGAPRHSTDFDVVIPAAATAEVRKWLKETGFALQKRSTPNPQNYSGQVETYRKGTVTLDLLSGAVRDREAAVDVPESWISMRPRSVILDTLSGRTVHRIPVARPEALWLLKLQAGRDLDLTDLFAISGEPVDLTEVREEFEKLGTRSRVDKVQLVLAKLGDRKLYADSLSRRGLGSPELPRNKVRWARFMRMAKAAVPPSACV